MCNTCLLARVDPSHLKFNHLACELEKETKQIRVIGRQLKMMRSSLVISASGLVKRDADRPNSAQLCKRVVMIYVLVDTERF